MSTLSADPEILNIVSLEWLFSPKEFAALTGADKQVFAYLLTLDPYYKPAGVTIH